MNINTVSKLQHRIFDDKRSVAEGEEQFFIINNHHCYQYPPFFFYLLLSFAYLYFSEMRVGREE